MKINDRERKSVLVKKSPKAESHNKGKVSEVREVAEKYGMNIGTLRQRHLREPDVPLEELAKRPVADRAQAARKGSHNWRKTNRS